MVQKRRSKKTFKKVSNRNRKQKNKGRQTRRRNINRKQKGLRNKKTHLGGDNENENKIQVIDINNPNSFKEFDSNATTDIKVAMTENTMVVGGPKQIEVWNWKNPTEPRRIINNDTGLLLFDIAIHGKMVVTSSQSIHDNAYSVKVWNVETGGLLHTFDHNFTMNRVAIHDKYVVSVCTRTGTVNVWNLEKDGDNKLEHTLQAEGLNTVAIHGQYVVSGMGIGSQDWTVKVWNVETGRLLHTFDNGNLVTSVAIHDKYVVSGSYKTVKVWNLEKDGDDKLEHTLEGLSGWVASVAIQKINDTEIRVVSLSASKTATTIKVWPVLRLRASAAEADEAQRAEREASRKRGMFRLGMRRRAESADAEEGDDGLFGNKEEKLSGITYHLAMNGSHIARVFRNKDNKSTILEL